jgi:hypothetical protein
MTPRYRKLLWVALALAGIRFVIFPWFERQTEWRDQLQVQTRRLDRSEALLANKKAIEEALVRAQTENRALLERFPQSTDPEAFKREAQQQVSSVATGLGLRVTYFDWIDEVDAVEGLGAQRARLTVEGGMRSLGLLQGALESRMPHFFVREVSYELRTPIGGAWEFPSSSTTTADFYFRQVASP